MACLLMRGRFGRIGFITMRKGLTFVLDKERKEYRKSDMPVFRGRYVGFGDLVLDGGAINPYGFIGYIPNTDLMDRGPDYGGMFISKDKVCEGTKWHTRIGRPIRRLSLIFRWGRRGWRWLSMEMGCEWD